MVTDEITARLSRRVDAAYKAWHTADQLNSEWAKSYWHNVICELMANWRNINPTKVN